MVGFTGIIGKVLFQHPFVIVFFRTFFAFFFIFLFFHQKNKKSLFQFTLKEHSIFFFTAIILVAHWVTFFLGIQKSSAVLGTLAFSIFPFFLTFLEPLFFPIKYSFYKSILCLFLLVGIAFLFPEISFENKDFVGICWGLLSGFFMALFIICNRFLSLDFALKKLCFFQNFYSSLIAFPFACLFLPWNISLKEFILLFILGVFCTGLVHMLNIFALKKISAQKFGVITSLESTYTVTFSFLLLGERLSSKGYLGALIILSSFLAFSFKKD